MQIKNTLTIIALTLMITSSALAQPQDNQTQPDRNQQQTNQQQYDYESPTLRPPKEMDPPRPWAEAAKNPLPPGEPETDYTPAVVPNGRTAEYKIVDGVKVFHLIAEPIEWEVAKGLTIKTWGYNGTVPGPMIELAAGDRVRIYVTNHLPAKTSVHWHGVLLPCGMDGVSGLTQPAIKPGETFVYEFIFPDSGTFMYHPHFDSMTQEGLGLTGMIIVHDRQPDPEKRPDRDFSIMLHEWRIKAGTARPNPNEMTDFNVLTMNGKAAPDTEPLVAKTGDRVWIRYGNLSPMDHHPIHLHGYAFKIIGSDGGWAQNKEALLPETTVLVNVGSAKVIELLADNPGDWLFHCHMTHHTMNQMGHDFPNMLGMDTTGYDEKVKKLIPGYMTMGTTGMQDMTRTGMPIPDNSIPMRGYKLQFGQTVLGSMANIFRVRDDIETYDDPGPYDFPEDTVAHPASQQQLENDGITIPEPKHQINQNSSKMHKQMNNN
ncbi:Copper resistance protein A precursor [Anaerohalosphaera lusitana]|uniref:Copper resistance protein A n=1 Tax=Anaerohalosphaera lusitana TaxID=1936003 RepID=A0A1U9NJN1_9BACT|nr:copper oxidase [Anaerohalosphaera lusitana]AQT68131.1 Copper resistance protein A precursor [Anaerohalosphaera lusitana]